MSKNQLHALSPLDGRYENSVKELSVYFSESALIKYRLKIEIEYLIALSREKGIKELPTLTKQEQIRLRKIYLNFNSSVAKNIKSIEKTTNHDVKAIEYYIQSKVKKSLHPWIHFALTSEDINNLSYSLMWQNGMKQALEFNKFLPIDSLILTKMDGTARGGIAVSLINQLDIPINFIGVGENVDDLVPFDLDAYLNGLILKESQNG